MIRTIRAEDDGVVHMKYVVTQRIRREADAVRVENKDADGGIHTGKYIVHGQKKDVKPIPSFLLPVTYVNSDRIPDNSDEEETDQKDVEGKSGDGNYSVSVSH